MFLAKAASKKRLDEESTSPVPSKKIKKEKEPAKKTVEKKENLKASLAQTDEFHEYIKQTVQTNMLNEHADLLNSVKVEEEVDESETPTKQRKRKENKNTKTAKNITETFNNLRGNPRKEAVWAYDQENLTTLSPYFKSGIVSEVPTRKPKPNLDPDHLAAEKERRRKLIESVSGTNDPSSIVNTVTDPSMLFSLWHSIPKKKFDDVWNTSVDEDVWKSSIGKTVTDEHKQIDSCPTISRRDFQLALTQWDGKNEKEKCLRGDACMFAHLCQTKDHPILDRLALGGSKKSKLVYGKGFDYPIHSAANMAVSTTQPLPMPLRHSCILCTMYYVHEEVAKHQREGTATLVTINPWSVKVEQQGEFYMKDCYAGGDYAYIKGCFPRLSEDRFLPAINEATNMAIFHYNVPPFQ